MGFLLFHEIHFPCFDLLDHRDHPGLLVTPKVCQDEVVYVVGTPDPPGDQVLARYVVTEPLEAVEAPISTPGQQRGDELVVATAHGLLDPRDPPDDLAIEPPPGRHGLAH